MIDPYDPTTTDDLTYDLDRKFKFSTEWSLLYVNLLELLDVQQVELRKTFLAILTPGCLQVPDSIRLDLTHATFATEFAIQTYEEIGRQLSKLCSDLLKEGNTGIEFRRVNRGLQPIKLMIPGSKDSGVDLPWHNETTLKKELMRLGAEAESLVGRLNRVFRVDGVLVNERAEGRLEKLRGAAQNVANLLNAAAARLVVPPPA